MKLFIPSRGRAGYVRTFDNLPRDAQERTHIIVPHDEVYEYKKTLPKWAKVLPCGEEGIGPTRQAITQIPTKDKAVLMLDDDLEFFARRTDDPTKLQKATEEDIVNMLNTCGVMLMAYAHIGVATREGANRNTSRFIYNTRLLRVLGYRTDVLRKHGVRFDRIPVMEDFDVALQLLRLGYKSCQINKWTQDQPASGSAGGCSIYRTMEVQAQGARGLAQHHPDFVKVVEKPPLKSGGWAGQPRLDVQIQWKKAFASAGEERNV